MRNNTGDKPEYVIKRTIKRGRVATTFVVVGLMCMSSLACADESSIFDEILFDLQIEGHIESPGIASIRTSFDFGGDGIRYDINDTNNLEHLMSVYQSQGVNIRRLRTAWNTEHGTITVGNDWSNFQDSLLPADDGASRSSVFSTPDKKQTTEQVAWSSRSGFSIAVEEPVDNRLDAANSDVGALQALTNQSPNLILSWQGKLAENAGQYRLSALGKKLDVNGVHNGVAVDDSELGWGVKLSGGWRVGGVLAALGVTLGNGIDSLILKQFGSDVAVSPTGQATTLKSISILPSLSYSIGENSDFRAALGRYQSTDNTDNNGIDTLDTINFGYTWNPWPSAKFGVEVVGKDFKGAALDEDSTEIKFGAEKRF